MRCYLCCIIWIVLSNEPGCKPTQTTSITPAPYTTHQTPGLFPQRTLNEKQSCTPPSDPGWSLVKSTYYALLRGAPCRFPHCQETCELNGASLVFPSNREHLIEILSNLSPGGETVFLGLHLPWMTNRSTSCRSRKCDKYLILANGTQHTWQPWMHHMLDRRWGQQWCYTTQLSPSGRWEGIRPTSCMAPRTLPIYLPKTRSYGWAPIYSNATRRVYDRCICPDSKE